MNANFDKAFKKFDECMTEFRKGIEDLFNGLTMEKEEGSRIRIKKGSKVYIGKGIAVKLINDVEAEILDDEPSAESPTKE